MSNLAGNWLAEAECTDVPVLVGGGANWRTIIPLDERSGCCPGVDPAVGGVANPSIGAEAVSGSWRMKPRPPALLAAGRIVGKFGSPRCPERAFSSGRDLAFPCASECTGSVADDESRVDSLLEGLNRLGTYGGSVADPAEAPEAPRLRAEPVDGGCAGSLGLAGNVLEGRSEAGTT